MSDQLNNVTKEINMLSCIALKISLFQISQHLKKREGGFFSCQTLKKKLFWISQWVIKPQNVSVEKHKVGQNFGLSLSHGQVM